MASEPRKTSPSGAQRRYLESPAAAAPYGSRPLATTPGLSANPFESHFMSTLHLPAFSPSVFAPPTVTPESQKKIPKPFRWDIETLAEVKPADIEEPVDPRQCTESYDMTQEEHIQRTISTFFSADLVAPSPLHQPAPSYNLLTSCPTGECLEDSLNSCKGHTRTVGCQTNLTLPPTLDIEKLLSQYVKSDIELDEMASTRNSSGDSSFSASSLRRKLFHCNNASSDDEDGGGITLDSAKAAGAAANTPVARIEQSPMLFSAQKPDCGRVAMTPYVACSPMILFGGDMANSGSCQRLVTRQRTCSFNSEDMASPEMSPIDVSRTPRHGPVVGMWAASRDGRTGATPTTVASAKAEAADRGLPSATSSKLSSRRQVLTGGGGSARKPGLVATTATGCNGRQGAANGNVNSSSGRGSGGSRHKRQDVTLVGSENDDDDDSCRNGAPCQLPAHNVASADSRGVNHTPSRGDMDCSSTPDDLLQADCVKEPDLFFALGEFAPKFAIPSVIGNGGSSSSSNSAAAAAGGGAPHHHHHLVARETCMSEISLADPSTSCCSSAGDNPNITWHPSSYSTPQKADSHSATRVVKPFA